MFNGLLYGLLFLVLVSLLLFLSLEVVFSGCWPWGQISRCQSLGWSCTLPVSPSPSSLSAVAPEQDRTFSTPCFQMPFSNNFMSARFVTSGFGSQFRVARICRLGGSKFHESSSWVELSAACRRLNWLAAESSCGCLPRKPPFFICWLLFQLMRRKRQ